jgi:phosphate transport system permease protein
MEAMSRSGGSLGDAAFHGLTVLFAVLVLLILSGVILALVAGAWPALAHFGFGFLVADVWNPVTEKFGAVAPIYGTLVTSAIAMLIGIPLAFGVALFITELCPIWLKRPLATMIELLAAIPSIIYGIWGLFVFAPFVQEHIEPLLIDTLGEIPGIGLLFAGPPLGIGVLTAGFILAVMVLPFISSIMRDVFETVPAVLKESTYALGATTTEVVWKVVLPYTRVGVMGGILLGLGRALGETMAVTMTVGNHINGFPTSLLGQGQTIASAIANELNNTGYPLERTALIEAGLVLLAIALIVNVVARLLVRRVFRGGETPV